MLVSQLAVWGTMDSRQPPNSDGQTPVQSFVHSLEKKHQEIAYVDKHTNLKVRRNAPSYFNLKCIC